MFVARPPLTSYSEDVRDGHGRTQVAVDPVDRRRAKARLHFTGAQDAPKGRARQKGKASERDAHVGPHAVGPIVDGGELPVDGGSRRVEDERLVRVFVRHTDERSVVAPWMDTDPDPERVGALGRGDVWAAGQRRLEEERAG